MNYYISDLHIGQESIINFDRRPFKNIDDMNETIVENWNAAVTKRDTVYILGDFIWHSESKWPAIVSELNGNKVLICGNHDPSKFSATTKRLFQDIKDYKEILDDGRHVIMCHYPIPFYGRAYDANVYMLYGHVHATREYAMMQSLCLYMRYTKYSTVGNNRGQLYNVGAMMPWMNYTPRTLDEIIKGANK